MQLPQLSLTATGSGKQLLPVTAACTPIRLHGKHLKMKNAVSVGSWVVCARSMAQAFLWLLLLGAVGSFTLGFSCGAVTFALTWGPVIGAKVCGC